jgi:hypothetical protein
MPAKISRNCTLVVQRKENGHAGKTGSKQGSALLVLSVRSTAFLCALCASVVNACKNRHLKQSQDNHALIALK